MTIVVRVSVDFHGDYGGHSRTQSRKRRRVEHVAPGQSPERTVEAAEDCLVLQWTGVGGNLIHLFVYIQPNFQIELCLLACLLLIIGGLCCCSCCGGFVVVVGAGVVSVIEVVSSVRVSPCSLSFPRMT